MVYHFDDGSLTSSHENNRSPRETALAIAARAAIAALSQNKVYPADIAAAKKWLADALAA